MHSHTHTVTYVRINVPSTFCPSLLCMFVSTPLAMTAGWLLLLTSDFVDELYKERLSLDHHLLGSSNYYDSL